MERKSLINSLKDHSISNGGSSNQNKNNNSNSKLKHSWNFNNQSFSGDRHQDYLSGFSWPPRSYTCSFCKREFRSAQALGGHMNVHRRDRARLRVQSPPPRDSQSTLLNLSTNTNPNPNFVASPFTASLPSSASSAEIHIWSSDDLTRTKTPKSFFDTEEEESDGCNLLKKAEIVRLDLEIGLFNDAKEDLDLELRLGYS